MNKKKIIGTIFGVILVAVVGVYTISPSTINKIIGIDKGSFIGDELKDRPFGILLKTPSKWKDSSIDLAVVYTGGSLNYKDNSIGISVINYSIKQSDEHFRLLTIIKADKEDWNSLKQNADIGEIQYDIQGKNSKEGFYKAYLKDTDFKVKEGKDFTYLIVCEKEDDALNKDKLKDVYVGIDELEKNFSVINNEDSSEKN